MTREAILVKATNWIGDLVMSLPALEGVRKSFPKAHITVLVRPPLDELLRGNPNVDEIMLYDKKGVHKGAAGLARIVREVRARKFKKAILFQNAFEAALITFLARIPERMGYTTDNRGMLLTKGVKLSDKTRAKHQVEYYRDLLAALGLDTNGETPKLYLTKEEKKRADETLASLGVPGDGVLIGVNPGAQYGVAKKWHPERFGAVADRLVSEFGAKIIIFGGPSDVTAAKAVQASMRREAVNLSGQTSIRELMALVRRCSLFITNDSGPMHISAALGVPTLAVFGSTNPSATGPASRKGRVVREPVQCSPCLKRMCPQKHYLCMERVKPEKVIRAAAEMLRERDE